MNRYSILGPTLFFLATGIFSDGLAKAKAGNSNQSEASSLEALPIGPPLAIRWKRLLPKRPFLSWKSIETSTPVLQGDVIYLGSARGHAVYAVHRLRGQLLWEQTVPGRVEASLAAADGRVFAGDSKGWLLALDADTGRVLWRENLGSVVLGSVNVDDETVYAVTAQNRVYALDVGTGAQRWVYRHPAPTGLTVYGASSPVTTEKYVISGFSDGSVVALDRTQGEVAWVHKIQSKATFKDVDATPVVSDGRVYISSFRGEIVALNLEGGGLEWKKKPGGSTRLMVTNDEIIYGTDDGEVISREKRNGRELWRTKIPKGLPSAPVLAGDSLWVGSSQGTIYALDPKSGEHRWKLKANRAMSGFNVPVISAREGLYAFSNAGILYSLKSEKNKLWDVDSAWLIRE